MAGNLKSVKAGAFDAIHETLFELCDNKAGSRACRGSCRHCEPRLKIMKELTRKNYWSKENTEYHMKSRLIALNKAHPSTPTPSEYRPIVVCSPVIKFLEGLLVDDLRRYLTEKMSKLQFGFVPGCGTDSCQ